MLGRDKVFKGKTIIRSCVNCVHESLPPWCTRARPHFLLLKKSVFQHTAVSTPPASPHYFISTCWGTPPLGSQTAWLYYVLTAPLGCLTVSRRLPFQTSPLSSGNTEILMVLSSSQIVRNIGLEDTCTTQKHHTWHVKCSIKWLRTRPNFCPLGS